jgi:hypothetical protein
MFGGWSGGVRIVPLETDIGDELRKGPGVRSTQARPSGRDWDRAANGLLGDVESGSCRPRKMFFGASIEAAFSEEFFGTLYKKRVR